MTAPLPFRGWLAGCATISSTSSFASASCHGNYSVLQCRFILMRISVPFTESKWRLNIQQPLIRAEPQSTSLDYPLLSLDNLTTHLFLDTNPQEQYIRHNFSPPFNQASPHPTQRQTRPTTYQSDTEMIKWIRRRHDDGGGQCHL